MEDRKDQDDQTPGGLEPEKVEDRPSVGIVKPEDYPEPAAGEKE
jgi:hypothetical protein